MDNKDFTSYYYFNQIVQSNIAFPELSQTSRGNQPNQPSVTISSAHSCTTLCNTGNLKIRHHWKDRVDRTSLSLYTNDNGYTIDFPGLAHFDIDVATQHISCHIPSSISNTTIRHLLLDQVLPRFFAHFNNHSVFHGCCIRYNNSAIAILGSSGFGKSTLAGFFSKTGCKVLTDDCFKISHNNTQLLATPSYHGMRMLPETFTQLKYSEDEIGDKVADYTNKRRIAFLPQRPEQTRLKTVFILSSPEALKIPNSIHIQPLKGHTVISQLLQNTFCLDVYDQQWQKKHFQRIAAIASSDLSVFTLNYPRKFDLLPAVSEAISQTISSQDMQN